jgi:hypothetical protein
VSNRTDAVAGRWNQAADESAGAEVRPLKTINGASIRPEMIDYIWDRRVVAGKLTMLAGMPEIGKTALALDILARATTGEPWPLETERRNPMNVFVAGPEDGIADTLVPRLIAAGADMSRVEFLDDRLVLTETARLEALFREKRIPLGFLDPITTFSPSNFKGNEEESVRGLLHPLIEAIGRTRTAVLFTKHTKKSPVEIPLDSVIGARAWGAIPRSVLGVGLVDPEDADGERVLCQIKLNVDRKPASLVYQIESRPHPAAPNDPRKSIAVVRWIRADGDLGARDVMGNGNTAGGGPQQGKAEEFLRQALAGGPMLQAQIEGSARAAGVFGSLRRAKKALEVESFQSLPPGTPDNPWWWRLPGQRSIVP